MDVVLVGAGKMGGALAQRWQETQLCRNLYIIDPQLGLSAPPQGIAPQVVVFAVKPQMLAEVAPPYRTYINAGALCLSIAAGKTISFFEQQFGAQAKVVRSMPNLPASIGRGITVAVANARVSDAEKDIAAQLLGAVGEVLWAGSEDKLDAVTALSGSGPAYVFLLIEALTHAGVKIGLDPEMAEKLARQTVIGSAALSEASPYVPAAILRQNVTSPGGTTQAALEVLMATPGIQDLFDRALAAACKRGQELAG